MKMKQENSDPQHDGPKDDIGVWGHGRIVECCSNDTAENVADCSLKEFTHLIGGFIC